MSNRFIMVDQVSIKQKLEGLVEREKTKMLVCNTILISTFIAIQGYLLFERI